MRYHERKSQKERNMPQDEEMTKDVREEDFLLK